MGDTPNLKELREMAESYFGKHSRWIIGPLLIIAIVAALLIGLRSIKENAQALVHGPEAATSTTPRTTPPVAIAVPSASNAASVPENTKPSVDPTVRRRLQHLARHGDVEVGSVTSRDQKGGVTAGYVGTVNQGASPTN